MEILEQTRLETNACTTCRKLISEYERVQRRRDAAQRAAQGPYMSMRERDDLTRTARYAVMDVEVVLLTLANHRANHN
jgi:hypothetical protein